MSASAASLTNLVYSTCTVRTEYDSNLQAVRDTLVTLRVLHLKCDRSSSVAAAVSDTNLLCASLLLVFMVNSLLKLD